MGKKKTFSKASKFQLLDWAEAATPQIAVTSHDDGFLYGMLEVDRRTRYIRLLDTVGFQICDGNFDRWANSVGETLRFPYTQADFDKTLAALVAIPLKKIREMREKRMSA